MSQEIKSNAAELATELTIAWLGNSNTRVNADDVPAFLSTMYQTINTLADGQAGGDAAEGSDTEPSYTPAATVRKSLGSKDHIISMIDGKPYKTLRRHLATNRLTPEEYRERYNLKPDYSMVAANYSAARSDMAKRLGLGRKAQAAEPETAPSPKPTPRRRARKPDEA